MKQPIIATFVLLALFFRPGPLEAQQRGAQGGAAQRTPREAAPFDITGYWVSVISEDWRVRMVMAQKGDWQFMPLSGAGQRVAEAADPAKEDPCKAYGAAGLMRLPTRLNVTWTNDTTLKLETDAGRQTRVFNFGNTVPAPAQPSLQGHSVANWEVRNQNPLVGGKMTPGGELRVVTTKMTPGYYFKHGIPYSENAVMTEYFSRIREGNSDYLLITTIVDDPAYLSQPYVKTLNFKREADGSKWSPAACSVP